MPQKVSVGKPDGYSTQHLKLGGKSQRTKDIRSATPRGFAIAVHDANKVIDNDHHLMVTVFDSEGEQIQSVQEAINERLETEGVV